ncbi:Homologous-pairing protein 2-like [Vitis vinifera]|uniref:Homologous-pairing protein 2 homolog n=1 Tax=Vitis vinifera TaxID=29760 RepID=A0A438FYI9_VITVI|nr:Homologous-pairing protein 2-like [Vitis vinifera]
MAGERARRYRSPQHPTEESEGAAAYRHHPPPPPPSPPAERHGRLEEQNVRRRCVVCGKQSWRCHCHYQYVVVLKSLGHCRCWCSATMVEVDRSAIGRSVLCGAKVARVSKHSSSLCLVTEKTEERYSMLGSPSHGETVLSIFCVVLPCMISAIFQFFFLIQQNRPLNSQNVADSLQKFNLKKSSVQKALDALADSGRISSKEYGKQKIYLARQDQFDIPNSEELSRMKEENAKLQQQLEEQKRAISEVEGEIKTLQSNLTLEQIRAKEAKLKMEVEEMEDKLNNLRGGVTLVKFEDRKVVEEMYSDRINQWRRRKRIFKDLWDAITENLPKDLKEFKEELAIEYDEDVGVSFQSLCDLMQHRKKRARCQ